MKSSIRSLYLAPALACALLVPSAFAQSNPCERGIRGYYRCHCNECVVDSRGPYVSAQQLCQAPCAAKAAADQQARIDRRERRTERVKGILEALQQIEEARRSTTKEDDDE